MPAVYQEWLNQNAYRSYPLKEDTRLISTDDARVTLPNYLIVDFVLTVAGPATIHIWLTNVSQVGGFLSFVFKDDNNNIIATLAVDGNAHTPNQAYAITGQDEYEDARGKIVLGDLSHLRTDFPDGAYAYAAELEPGVVRPDLRGVRSIRVGSDTTLSPRITGNVKFLEGNNIRLTYLPDYNMIRIDALDTTGFDEECECEPPGGPDCIRRINGINIEDVQIIGDGNCMEVVTTGNIITLKDRCSEPCCGCPELEFITQNLELLQSTLSRVESLASLLQTRYQEFVTSLLASTKGSG